MMRHASSSDTTPYDLNRRSHIRGDRVLRWDSEATDDVANGGLDLSIHRTNSPFNNRFGTLATPPPAVTRDRDFYVSSQRRRLRNSRGTKEAKKRRDARRNRRKLAAQFLDEHLSQDIDETLIKANVRPPPLAILPAPTPVMPTTTFWSTPRPSDPPETMQIPPLDFSAFDIHDFPLLVAPSQSPQRSPQPPQPLLAEVPSWCPQIPSLLDTTRLSRDWPKFFDLSHLPEKVPSSPQRVQCQELQLWQGDLSFNPRKQSRFFPSQPLTRPVVKLPSTACTLHRSEDVSQDASQTSNGRIPLTKSDSISDIVERIVATAEAEANIRRNEEACAANLWHILSTKIERQRVAHTNGRDSTWDDELGVNGGVPLANASEEQTIPAELDGKEIPYAHANSLTGFANEVAELHSGTRDCDELLDSAICLAEAMSLIDNDACNDGLVAMPLPLTPTSPTSDTGSLFELAADNSIKPETNTDSDDLPDPVAHYNSEQKLFEMAPSDAPSQSPIEDSCDLETFLAMGHVEKCWCRDCEEEPELVNDDWSPAVTESDDWVMWSHTNDSTTSSTKFPQSAPVAGTVAKSDDSFQAWTTAYDWADLYPSTTPYNPVPELDDEFIGCHDDSAAFTPENNTDWMWSS